MWDELRLDNPRGASFFEPWVIAFEAENVTWGEAKAATTYYALSSPGFPERHICSLMAIIKAGRLDDAAEREQALRVERLRQVDEARQQSADLTTVWECQDESFRQHYRDMVIAETPSLRAIPKFVEAHAKMLFAADRDREAAESLTV
jgi:hypothetical protein